MEAWDSGGEELQARPRRGGALDIHELPPTRELVSFYRSKIGTICEVFHHALKLMGVLRGV